VPKDPARRRTRRDLVRAGGLGLALAGLVAARAAAIRVGVGDPIASGLLFGLALLALAALDRRQPWPALWARLAVRTGPAVRARAAVRAPSRRAVGIGVAGGLALVALALLGRAVAGAPVLPPVFRADLFPTWALATVVVATGEEAALRGRLLRRLAGPLGLAGAVLVTSAAFALMHVPFYGWRVVPLDLGVGVFLAGLRIAGRGIAAPAIAHAIADLATWWL
jgi:membrane protease YdiL (CAAX protease family)